MTDEQQTNRIPEFNWVFLKSFSTAMSAILAMPEHEAVLLRFLSAYEYRGRFSWLEESRQGSHGDSYDGLSYALQAALATYIVVNADNDSQYTQEKSKHTLLYEQKFHLFNALQATIDEKISLERFEHRLSRAGLNGAELPLVELQKHILHALDNYYRQRMKGIANDPF